MTILRLSVFILLCLFLVGNGVAAVFPLGRAPFALHTWWPFPVACAGASCATYAEWARAMQTSSEVDTLQVLSTLVTRHATRVVASMSGVRVQKGEVNQALAAIHATLDNSTGGVAMLQKLYGLSPDTSLKTALSFLLLQDKLAAIGISSPWGVQTPPSVSVWNIHLRWDNKTHTLTTRSVFSALASP